MPEREPAKSPEFIGMGMCIALGASLGMLFGMLFDNLALGLSFGVAGGTVVGAIVESRRRNGDSETPDR